MIDIDLIDIDLTTKFSLSTGQVFLQREQIQQSNFREYALSGEKVPEESN